MGEQLLVGIAVTQTVPCPSFVMPTVCKVGKICCMMCCKSTISLSKVCRKTYIVHGFTFVRFAIIPENIVLIMILKPTVGMSDACVFEVLKGPVNLS